MSFKKNGTRIALAACLFAASGGIFAQTKILDKANELYKTNQYAEAAELYEQALDELEKDGKANRNNLNLKTKLAYCYRMNNKMGMAEALYAEVVQDPKAKPDTYYYYGEALMGNGKYEAAKKWFLDYQRLEPNDEKGRLMAEACDKVAFIPSFFQDIEVTDFVHNSPADDNAPVAWHGGILFSSDREQGIKLLKEKSGWTGRDYLNLYLSEKTADNTYLEPKEFSSRLSEVNKNVGNASVTADGAEIYFTRNDNELNKQNTYSLQIFRAENGGNGRWKNVEKLPFCSPNFNFMHPAISPDGKKLFFATNKSGGMGGTDLWVADRNGSGWGAPVNLGPVVNTLVNEGFPFVDNQGRLFFCSKGHPGFGGFDIFYTSQDADGQWSAPVNVGRPVNSPFDDISISFNNDLKTGMFTSSRNGGDDDIYLFHASGINSEEQPLVPISAKQEELHATGNSGGYAAVGVNLKEENPLQPIENQADETEVEIPEVKPEKAPTAAGTAEKPAPAVSSPVENKNKPSQELTPPLLVDHAPAVAPAESQQPTQEEQVVPDEKRPSFGVEMSLTTTAAETSAVAATATAGEMQQQAAVQPVPVGQLGAFLDFTKNLELGYLVAGQRFRLDGATYDPEIWQLTPKVTAMLDKLAAQLKIYPSLQVEISSHTESLGTDEGNLRLSQNRAATIAEYLTREGIAAERILVKGCGETMPLNHCRDGVECSLPEHLFNQRIEVKILAIDGRW